MLVNTYALFYMAVVNHLLMMMIEMERYAFIERNKCKISTGRGISIHDTHIKQDINYEANRTKKSLIHTQPNAYIDRFNSQSVFVLRT